MTSVITYGCIANVERRGKDEPTIDGNSSPDDRVSFDETLAGPIAANPDFESLREVAPGNYVIAGTVAQGGMGRVLRARDRRLGRDVAIKELIKPSPELAARFEREVRITATLQHPSIVTVHEAGTWRDGEPFYAMELVSGRALDAVVRDATTTTDRLALVPHVIAVAEALAYAHSRGVIHRDLKPANVLVGEFGETVVIDWGLAKDLRASPANDTPLPQVRGAKGETAYGAVVGTPAYMPPEQARGDRVDERADVYAIGAMLYSVLAGRPPFDGDSADIIIDRVIDQRPRLLSDVVPETPRDLAAIVGKAMSRVPDNRYRDARELAHDLRRFQTGQLVGARRYTLLQRVWRFIAKHRTVVAVIAVATIAIAVLSGVSIARIVDERDSAQVARRDAEAQRTRAETERTRADTERGGAEGLVSFMLTELKPQLERVGRLDVMQGVAKHVDGYYNSLAARAETLDRDEVLRRISALQVLGDVLYAAGDSQASNRSYEQAIERATPLAVRDKEAAIALARAQNEYAASLLEAGKVDEAEALLERARAALEAIPDHASVAILLAIVHRRLSTAAFLRGKLDDALAQLTHCFDAARSVVDDPTQRRAARLELAKCYDRDSDAESGRNNWAAAELAARSALALRQDVARDDPGDLDVRHGIVISWDKLFELALSAEKLADAKLDADALVAAAEPLVSRDPDNAEWARSLAVGYQRFAELESARGHAAEAAKKMLKAVAVTEAIAARDQTNLSRAIDLADFLCHRAGYLLDAQDPAAALPVLQRALELAQPASAASPTNTQYALSVASIEEYLGDAFRLRSEWVKSEASYRARLAIDEDMLRRDPDNPRLVVNVLSTKFSVGEVMAGQEAKRADGLALMTTTLATLHQLATDGKLSPNFVQQDLVVLDQRLKEARAATPSRP